MFSKDIVHSDAFLDLPISSQALYFHLGMEADDRGYVSNPKTVIRSIGASIGDLEQLVQKKFILVRGDGLILIKHWKINNCIQPSRLVETKYTTDLKKLFFDENNSYTERDTKNPVLWGDLLEEGQDYPTPNLTNVLSTSCQQNVDKSSTDYQQVTDKKGVFCQQNNSENLSYSLPCQQSVADLSSQYRIGKDSIGFRINKDKTDKKDKTTVDTAEIPSSCSEKSDSADIIVQHHVLTKLLIRLKYLEPNEFNLDDYDRLFDWLARQYGSGRIAVATKYIVSKAPREVIKSKYSYFKKALLENLEKDYETKTKENPGDSQEITQYDVDQLLEELGDT